MATPTTSDTPLLCLHPEERRKKLLDSLREGYSGAPQVFGRLSKEVSRYVSQFTSDRWRGGIWKQEEETVYKTQGDLVIHGYDLQCEDYIQEQEMMTRWHIIERELHFPNLEDNFMRKQGAKSRSGARVPRSRPTTSTRNVETSTEPTTEDIPMDKGHDSSRKDPDDMETSTIVGGQESSTGAGQQQSEVEMSEEAEVSPEAGKPGSEVEASKAEIAAGTIQHEVSGLFLKPGKTDSEVEMSEEAEVLNKVDKPESEVMEVSGDAEVSAEVLKKESLGLVHECSPQDRDSNKESQAVSDKAIRTSEGNIAESSGEKVAASISESSGVVEEKKFEGKMGVETIQECNKAKINSETDMEPSNVTSNGMKSLYNSVESYAAEAKESENKMEDTTISESSTVSKTSETNETENVTESNESSCVSEIKDPDTKVDVIIVSENSGALATSETDAKHSEISKTESVRDSNTNSESSVSEAKDESTNKMASETVQDFSQTSKTSETDMEIPATSSRSKRKADSMSKEDLEEKKSKKMSTEL